jgi:hypothetical protein
VSRSFEGAINQELEEVTTGLLSKVIEIAFPGQAGRKKSTAASVSPKADRFPCRKKTF